jgi:hypothetical protein
MPKSTIDEIKELKAQIQSKREAAATEALKKAREGVTVLRELEIDDDTILKGLGFRGRTPRALSASEASKAKGRTGPSDEPCSICDFQTDPPHDGRSHRSQTKKKPFTEEELEEKGLTKT